VQPSTPLPSFPRPVVVPRWIPIALGELGVVEDTRPGRSERRIEQYHAATRGGHAVDDVAWCASYVAWVLESAGVPSSRRKQAISYATWGTAAGWDAFGGIVLFPRTDPDAGGTGHVAFLLGVSGKHCFVLGGNQANAVTIAKRETVGASVRWPHAIAVASTPPPSV
jgi:uncharacterized protein (TIGR02594 family)